MVSHEDGVSLGLSFIRMVSDQGGLSSGWFLILSVFHTDGLSLGLSLIRVVSHEDGLSSGLSFIRVIFHQGGLSLGWFRTGMISREASTGSTVPHYENMCGVHVFKKKKEKKRK